MSNTHIQKLRRYYRYAVHRYGTLNNVVIAAAIILAMTWAVSSIGVMEKNYQLQQDLGREQQRLSLVKLQVESLQYRKNYYQTDEYKELSVRQHLGLGFPDEKTLILPENSEAAKQYGQASISKQAVQPKKSNFAQWMDFFGHGTSNS